METVQYTTKQYLHYVTKPDESFFLSIGGWSAAQNKQNTSGGGANLNKTQAALLPFKLGTNASSVDKEILHVISPFKGVA